jgi:preprotein translocase subunit Sss1
MSDKKEKGVLKELTDFYNASKNFIQNCEKPDRKGNKHNKFIRIHDNC